MCQQFVVTYICISVSYHPTLHYVSPKVLTQVDMHKLDSVHFSTSYVVPAGVCGLALEECLIRS